MFANQGSHPPSVVGRFLKFIMVRPGRIVRFATPTSLPWCSNVRSYCISSVQIALSAAIRAERSALVASSSLMLFSAASLCLPDSVTASWGGQLLGLLRFHATVWIVRTENAPAMDRGGTKNKKKQGGKKEEKQGARSGFIPLPRCMHAGNGPYLGR